jgi:hypothetical protein
MAQQHDEQTEEQAAQQTLVGRVGRVDRRAGALLAVAQKTGERVLRGLDGTETKTK